MISSRAQSPWPADEAVAGNVEAQEAVRFARDPDPGALADGTSVLPVGSEPERASAKQIQPVQTPIDVQRGRQTPGPARQIQQTLHPAVLLHHGDAVNRL